MLASLAWAQGQYPAPQGWVNDFAQALNTSTRERLHTLLADLEQRTTVEVAVVVVHTTAPLTPKQYATELYNRWGIGKKGADNGVLILLALQDRRVEVETGYGVEGILPDGRVGEIIRTAMLPHFKNNRWGEGLLAGTQHMAHILQSEFQAPRAPAPSSPFAWTARHVVYGIGWAYFLVWLGVLLVHNVLHRTLSYGTLALMTLPGLLLVFFAFFPFVLPLLIGLFAMGANVRARCPKCGHWLASRRRTLQAPSYSRPGLREIVYDCPACSYHNVDVVTLPSPRRVVRTPTWTTGGGGFGGWPGGGGSFGTAPRSGGSFRRFGGGSSGGGGAGASF
jgi:uncharacterized membrane protein YgcG